MEINKECQKCKGEKWVDEEVKLLGRKYYTTVLCNACGAEQEFLRHNEKKLVYTKIPEVKQ